MQNHYLDSGVWDSENWVREFEALLDAIEVQFAIEAELSDEPEPGEDQYSGR